MTKKYSEEVVREAVRATVQYVLGNMVDTKKVVKRHLHLANELRGKLDPLLEEGILEMDCIRSRYIGKYIAAELEIGCDPYKIGMGDVVE